MSRYTTKLQNIQEANIRLEKRMLNEQVENTKEDLLLSCLKRHFNVNEYKGTWCKSISDSVEKTKNDNNITDKLKQDCATELNMDRTKIDELVKCLLYTINAEPENLEDIG
jgi:hypothetical protein